MNVAPTTRALMLLIIGTIHYPRVGARVWISIQKGKIMNEFYFDFFFTSGKEFRLIWQILVEFKVVTKKVK